MKKLKILVKYASISFAYYFAMGVIRGAGFIFYDFINALYMISDFTTTVFEYLNKFGNLINNRSSELYYRLFVSLKEHQESILMTHTNTDEEEDEHAKEAI